VQKRQTCGAIKCGVSNIYGYRILTLYKTGLNKGQTSKLWNSSHITQIRVYKTFRGMFYQVFIPYIYIGLIHQMSHVPATVRHFRFIASDTETNETNSSIITTNCCITIRYR